MCNLTKSINAQTCDEQNMIAGGNDFFYLAFIDKVNAGGLSGFTQAAGVISALTFTGGSTGLQKYFTARDGVSTSAETNDNLAQGKPVTQKVVALMKVLEADKLAALDEIVRNKSLVAIVPTKNREIRVYGIFDSLDTTLQISKGMQATLAEATGAAMTDEVGHTLTLSGMSMKATYFKFNSGSTYDASIAALEAYIGSGSGSGS